MASSFGPIFTSKEFDDNVVAFIQEWIDTYLSEMELRGGYPRRSTDRPKSYNNAVTADNWQEELLPGVLVVSSGFVGPPVRVGAGMHDGWWEWTVAVILTGRDYDSARLKVSLFSSALRAMIIQNPSLGGFVQDTVWESEPVDFAPMEGRTRTRGVAALQFRSYIEGIVDSSMGPSAPDGATALPDPNTPHPDAPVVDTVAVTLTKTPL